MLVNDRPLKMFRMNRNLLLMGEQMRETEVLMLPDTRATRDLVKLGWVEEIPGRQEATEFRGDENRQEPKGQDHSPQMAADERREGRETRPVKFKHGGKPMSLQEI